MCLALVAFGAHPRYALVVAANRDEFHARPTAPAHWWPEGWLGGRDLSAGGTWCGTDRRGRFALVTNVREPARHDPAAPSRGALVTGFLADRGPAGAALDAAVAAGAACNGFNLLAGDRGELHYGSNRAAPRHALAAGVYGLSNAALDTGWPKVTRAKAALARWCAAGDDDPGALFGALADTAIAADADLPATGVALAWERRLSAPFIVGVDYGTRASTLILFDRGGDVRFVERRFGPEGRAAGEQDVCFAAG